MALQPPPPGFVAATPTPTFATTVFNDANKDPDRGNYAHLMAPFLIDIANANNNLTPAEIRARVNSRTNNMDPQALCTFVGSAARVYLCPKTLEQPLGAGAHARWDVTYAFDGDLLDGTSYNVILPNNDFNLITNIVDVPTVPTVIAAIAGYPNLELMGPYANGDAGTETVRVRKIVPIPFAYTNIFLANTVTPRFYFQHIYPQMVTDGNDADCTALHRFFQVAITTPGAGLVPVNAVGAAAPVPRDPIIHQSRTRLLHMHLPGLGSQAVQAQHNAIAVQLATLATQQQTFRAQDQQAKAAASSQPVEDWLGSQQLQKLLRYSHAADESGLAPIWAQLAAAKKSERIGLVQGQYDHYREQLNEPHLTMVADLSVITTATSVSWEMATKNAIKTGVQPFRFPDTDLEAYQLRNAEITLMMEGSTQTTMSDARTIAESKLVLPSNESSNRNIRRAQIWALTFLPAQHPMQQYLGEHHDDMQSFKPVWETWSPALRPLLHRAKGVYHCKFVANVMSEYWRQQGRQPNAQPLESPLYISSSVNSGRQWEPILDESFLTFYKVYEFCGVSPGVTGLPSNQGAGGGSFGGGSGGSGAAGGGGAGHAGGGSGSVQQQGGASGRVNNTQFNTALFQTFKSNSVRCVDIRRKITEGTKPALPTSKVDQAPMCLAWHTKGQCNRGCPRAADHVVYSNSEYQPLATWCTAHYLN